ncbi:uncharacterized protein L969DRAFT_99418 [Mixia osmundae IAM 14324]|uniref:malate dehydrogenase n=1 Tax=Mixia osmundae (strain CBS 9802 / IAM 14324 / JCM 22182 / KY 12970) TaxID=764103 RepID=G7E0E6_MIXOS|nr:uncharacterized protein L969DRAFT_99418 [Mixia osmundae IAM 14324]KEI38315.1 hypothetical protein L969DRAFT_99418 [Mixia osmundae IAM 14324]GAA96306.1 hypothetical protein E5Q_02972 [Mixia osmundae IAM 14324]
MAQAMGGKEPTKKIKAALLGAAGGIGQPLALLLKQSPHLTDLALFDIAPVVKGVAVDISHISTPSIVTGYDKEDDGLVKALTDADIVVIPAGVPRKPGMSRDDLFNINASIVRDLAQSIASTCPKAFICVISNPVNSTVPIVAEVLKKAGVFDPKRLFGVTTLDILRAQTFSAEIIGQSNASSTFNVPVIGGHSGVTILPLLSQSKPPLKGVSQEQIEALTKRIQFGGDEVVQAKAGAGSATLSMAAAGFRFVERLIDAAFNGKSGVVEDSYILLKADASGSKELLKHTDNVELDYFSVPVELGPEGVKKILPIGELSEYEQTLMKKAVEELKGNIVKGVSFVEAKL